MQLQAACDDLFEHLPDVVFFRKDAQGRYTHANRTLLARLGLRKLEDLLGRTAAEVFPAELGAHYLAQDLRVIAGSESVHNELERHLFPNHRAGWCLTVKHALSGTGTAGKAQGLVGISRDLRGPSAQHPAYARLARSLAYAREHCTEPLGVRDLARHAGMSVSQLERHLLALLQLTPGRWLLSLRLEHAVRLLGGDRPIAHVAAESGFSDHSAFSRAFRRHIGTTPQAWRQIHEAAELAPQSLSR